MNDGRDDVDDTRPNTSSKSDETVEELAIDKQGEGQDAKG
jgi:hypothetical protein